MSFENCVEADDDEVIPSVTSDYWLKGGKTRCLLAFMVHLTNKETGSNIAAFPLGQSKEAQCNNAVARIFAESDAA